MRAIFFGEKRKTAKSGTILYIITIDESAVADSCECLIRRPLSRCHHSCFRVDRGQGIAIRARSRGFVHIFFALAVFLGISVWGISEVLRYVTETRQTAEQRELESLHRARRALLNYASLSPPDLPGQNGAFNVFGFNSSVNSSVTMTFSRRFQFRPYELPCPDVFDASETPPRLDGIADYSGLPVCGETGDPLESGSWVGRFPWRSLSGAGNIFVRGAGGEDLRDSAKERLWYAVSHNVLPSARPRQPLNLHYLLSREDWLTVTDARSSVTISNRVAAVVIAPREQSDEDGLVFGLFEDTPRSGRPTPSAAEAAAAYLDEENRDGDRVFVNTDSYRGALSPESDANQTLDLLALVHIEDFPDAPPPDGRLCDSAAGGDSAAIEVLRAHLIQRGSLPDPAVFEEEAATIAHRLPGFSPSQGDAATIDILSESIITVTSPATLGAGRLVIPELLLSNPDAGVRFDASAVFPGDMTISGFQIIPRVVFNSALNVDVTLYAVQHRSVGGDLNINTTVRSRSDDLFDPGDSSVPFLPEIHGFPSLDENFNPDYGITKTTITTGVAVRASLIRRGATVVGGVVTLGLGETVEARPRLFVDGDSLPPFFIWPGSSIAINALLDLDPKPPFNAAIAALETRYVDHEESRVSTMLALADPDDFASHLPRALFGEGGSAPTFAEPVGGATDVCYTIESARARTLDEGELVMALARPRHRIFSVGLAEAVGGKSHGRKDRGLADLRGGRFVAAGHGVAGAIRCRQHWRPNFAERLSCVRRCFRRFSRCRLWRAEHGENTGSLAH